VEVGVIASDRPISALGITDVARRSWLAADDMRGRQTRLVARWYTVVAVADQLASAAELAPGKTSRRPLADSAAWPARPRVTW
jgi:F420-0:gamma-glutamyl ligase